MKQRDKKAKKVSDTQERMRMSYTHTTGVHGDKRKTKRIALIFKTTGLELLSKGSRCG
jgi:hypothetical protein